MIFVPTGVVDILDQANRRVPPGLPAYRITTAPLQAHRTIRGRSGLPLLADSSLDDIDPSREWDTIVVSNQATGPEQAELSAQWLRQAALLVRRRATTHWQHFDTLARLSPTTEVDRDSIYVHDGPFWTSAGASSGFDLTLALVSEDLGSAVEREVASELVLDLCRPGGQAQFSRFLASQAAPETPIVRIKIWALDHLQEDLSISRTGQP